MKKPEEQTNEEWFAAWDRDKADLTAVNSHDKEVHDEVLMHCVNAHKGHIRGNQPVFIIELSGNWRKS